MSCIAKKKVQIFQERNASKLPPKGTSQNISKHGNFFLNSLISYPLNKGEFYAPRRAIGRNVLIRMASGFTCWEIEGITKRALSPSHTPKKYEAGMRPSKLYTTLQSKMHQTYQSFLLLFSYIRGMLIVSKRTFRFSLASSIHDTGIEGLIYRM